MIGEKITEKRKEKGMTQEELSKRSGITRVAISLQENNRIKPRISTLKKIAKALEIDVEYLLDESTIKRYYKKPKEMTEEEKQEHIRKQKQKAQKKYYEKNKEKFKKYYKEYYLKKER